MSSELRRRLIRLASEKPEFRGHILPLLTMRVASHGFEREIRPLLARIESLKGKGYEAKRWKPQFAKWLNNDWTLNNESLGIRFSADMDEDDAAKAISQVYDDILDALKAVNAPAAVIASVTKARKLDVGEVHQDFGPTGPFASPPSSQSGERVVANPSAQFKTELAAISSKMDKVLQVSLSDSQVSTRSMVMVHELIKEAQKAQRYFFKDLNENMHVDPDEWTPYRTIVRETNSLEEVLQLLGDLAVDLYLEEKAALELAAKEKAKMK